MIPVGAPVGWADDGADVMVNGCDSKTPTPLSTLRKTCCVGAHPESKAGMWTCCQLCHHNNHGFTHQCHRLVDGNQRGLLEPEAEHADGEAEVRTVKVPQEQDALVSVYSDTCVDPFTRVGRVVADRGEEGNKEDDAGVSSGRVRRQGYVRLTVRPRKAGSTSA